LSNKIGFFVNKPAFLDLCEINLVYLKETFFLNLKKQQFFVAKKLSLKKPKFPFKKTKFLSNKLSLFPIGGKKTGLLAKKQVYWTMN
jgi:hypothetical protein